MSSLSVGLPFREYSEYSDPECLVQVDSSGPSFIDEDVCINIKSYFQGWSQLVTAETNFLALEH